MVRFLCNAILATGLLVKFASAQVAPIATFGEVIPLSGTPADIVLDEARQRLYLVNAPANRVDVYDYLSKTVVGSIAVGQNPLGAAISMDGVFLYVANHDSSSLSVIRLGGTEFGDVTGTVGLQAKPQGVEVGFDGRVLISTDGGGANNLFNTLLLYDGLQAEASQVLAVQFPPAPATPPTLAPLVVRPTVAFNGRLARTPDGKYIIGVSSITNNTSTVVYVYEAASGTVLQSRTVTGQSSTLSVSPDGATFMAGFNLYDVATLNVIATQSASNAPFQMTALAPANNLGGSVFAPGGSTLYSAFNTTAQTNSATQSFTLLISDPRSLGIKLGINLPDSILSKMVITADGSQLWALSTSGVLFLPMGRLFEYPILMPETTAVFLAQDDCQLGIAKVSIKINNIGGGTLTFAVPSTVTNGTPAVVLSAASGVAPSSLTFTMDSGRTAVVRTPGTNLYTGGGVTNQGTAINVGLYSPNAINIPPTIRVYMNYRDSSMRGIIYPVATSPNATVTSGLSDIVLDEPRHRVYISNAGYNRIEVFDTQKAAFETPIPTGQLPRQMAMGLDGSTLYVETTGGEQVQIIDLESQQAVGAIVFPPIPRAGNALPVSVLGMANGLSGLQLITTNGTLWKVINNQAVPRVATSVTGMNTTTGAQTPINTSANAPASMIASDDGTFGVLLGGNGVAYLYDGLTDAYTATSRLFGNANSPIIGFYGPLGVSPTGSFLLANGLVTSRSLTPIGGAASPGSIAIQPGQPGPGGGGFPTIGVSSSGLRNIAATAPVSDSTFVRMSTAVRNTLTAATNDDIHTILEAVDTKTGGTALAGRMPENPVQSVFSTTRTAMPTRQMVVDSQGTVYALTLSGLSVVPLTPANANTQPKLSATRPIVNSSDGTGNLKPGTLVTINGTNLASESSADVLPPPTVLGGSCVLINDVAIPLITTAAGQIAGQIPANVRTGSGVLQVRSLATAQQSTRIVINIQRP